MLLAELWALLRSVRSVSFVARSETGTGWAGAGVIAVSEPRAGVVVFGESGYVRPFLPLHVARVVSTAFAQRNDVIDHIARATVRIAAQPLELQVIEEDVEAWRKGLASVPNVEIVTMTGLNHLFILGSGKPGPAEYDTPGHVDGRVIDRLAAFISTGSLNEPSAKPLGTTK